ncbi:MAG: phosphoenolpyruvate carboxykinase (ATP), partial [Rhodobacteraceae bacterium]|nr:phosphoenolpyruvate carboxykinase (ATP) [Paracoccaceae bacterium]
GKTTLSTDESLTLVGDDEHGWSDDGVFTIEGGCYAKTQGLDPGKEADIHAASTQFGTVLENVIIDPATNMPDFSDTCLTENTRSAYDISKIPGAAASGCAGHPRHVFLLACDAFGVLPPIARLTHQQAVDIFMTGYTSKVAGTERGIRTPTPVFSECYARPFLPRPPSVYRVMFLERIRSSKSQCWLINTGWQGGPAGTGQRIALEYTRRIIAAAINNELGDVDTDTLPFLDLQIPTSIDGIPGALLNPAHAWPGDGYNQAAGKLADMISRHMSSSDPRKSGSMPN